ncbi:MAG: large subunit ribosomal protein L13 [Candidatus Peregrinibacteria bacterium Greene0416_19]|nr:MAG: large subunit ribosomal protein L13 [Candidatus Peregrinibacteria bacterium Greene0416_19]
MRTSTVKPPAPTWHVVDVAGQSLGRVATRVAHVIRGKHRPTFSPHQLCGDHVILLNVEKLDVTPVKGRRKTYYHHTGRPSGMHSYSLTQMMERNPVQVMELAVKGMLPRNRLRNDMLRRLHVFTGAEHPYAPQKPQSLDLSTLL